MEHTKSLNRTYEAIVWGLLLILWGVTILFDFIPFGIGVAGTGLIVLGANLVRLLNHLPARDDNAVFGTLMLAWGGLELGRPLLRTLFQAADLDWVIFAILLVGLGFILLIRALLRSWKMDPQKE